MQPKRPSNSSRVVGRTARPMRTRSREPRKNEVQILAAQEEQAFKEDIESFDNGVCGSSLDSVPEELPLGSMSSSTLRLLARPRDSLDKRRRDSLDVAKRDSSATLRANEGVLSPSVPRRSSCSNLLPSEGGRRRSSQSFGRLSIPGSEISNDSPRSYGGMMSPTLSALRVPSEYELSEENGSRMAEITAVDNTLTHMEKALSDLRRMNERLRSAAQPKTVRDQSTQYSPQDAKIVSPSQNLLGLHRIPVLVTRKNEGAARAGLNDLVVEPAEDTEKGELRASAALYSALLDMFDVQHDLPALCRKFTQILGQAVACNVHLFTCLAGEIRCMGNCKTKTYQIDRGIIGHVVKTQKALILKDPTHHRAYDATVDQCYIKGSTHYYIPLKWGDKVMGVVQMFTKEEATPSEMSVVTLLSLQAASLLALHHPDVAKMEINASILRAVGDLSTSMFEDSKLVERIMESSKMLLNAERCALFHVDTTSQQLVSRIEGTEVRMPLTSGIAGVVAVSAKGLNIPNAYSDPRFNKSVDKQTGFHTRQILCMPLKCEGRVIAVAQLVNKCDPAASFSHYDEKVFETYSDFAAIALRNCSIFKEADAAREYNKVLLDLASELGKVTLDDTAVKEKVIVYARSLVNADRGTLFVADWESSQLIGTVNGNHLLRMPINSGVAGAVAMSGQSVNVADAYADPRFNHLIDQETGYTTETILSTPIKYDGRVIAVAQLINKLPDQHGKRQHFTETDETILRNFGTLAGIAIHTADLYRRETREKEHFCSMLGAVANMIEFDIRGQQKTICEKIVSDSVRVVKCQHVNVFLLHDGEIGDQPYVSSQSLESGNRIVCNRGVAKKAATRASAVVIHNPDDSSLVDVSSGGHPQRSILAMPITSERRTLCKSEHDTVLAVVEFINKEDGAFTDEDVSNVGYYLNLTACTMRNTRFLEFEKENKRGAMELLTHANKGTGRKGTLFGGEFGENPAMSECMLAELSAVSVPSEKLKTLAFDMMQLEGETEELAHVLHMYESLGLLDALSIDKGTLVNFLMRVRTGYRSVPYHNFTHALDVTQCVYALFHIVGKEATAHFTALEQFMLLTCAVCHDVDHMGVNNSFHYGCETPLGILSNATGSSSPLEVHHCNVMFGIMAAPGCQIFSVLDRQEQTDAYKLAIELILATDMEKHKDILQEFAKLRFDPARASHRQLALVVLLKYADISSQSRPFSASRIWADKIMEEFHIQGDEEKERLGKVSAAHFDRLQSETPVIQIGFIQHVCEPFLDLLVQTWPSLNPVRQQLVANKKRWLQEKERGQTVASEFE